MNLLPKSSSDFSKTDYWNSFFKKRGTKAFEWYGEYPELAEYLDKYIKQKDDILMVGCGNSTLSADLYDVGYRSIANIDISEVVVEQMIRAHKTARPEMSFARMDALRMTFADESFNVVLDKGTLDALMADDSAEVADDAAKYFAEVGRVLRPAGRYVCVSLLQEHIVKRVLEYFANDGWMLRIVRCHEAEAKSARETEGLVMPVFVVIANKFKNLPQPVLEICLAGQKIVRCNGPEEVAEAILNAQNVAVVTNGLTNKSLKDKEEIMLELTRPDETIVRYTIHVVDQFLIKRVGLYAAFIVPQGRELDWLFATKEGRKTLLKSVAYNRLAIVSMHRFQSYGDLDDVKAELEESIQNLAPKEMSGQIRFLSLADDIGKRDIIHRGNSEVSGDFIVEEVRGQNDEIYRRLVFLNNPFVTQSESKLVYTKDRKGKKTLGIDFGYLACSHHIYMTVGIELAVRSANSQSPGHAVIIGLGGGGLCSFLQRCFDRLKITAIDIDAEMLNMAQKYFGLVCDDERLSVVIKDGLKCLEEYSKNGQKFSAILYDVDSKDTSVGMSCPPKQFLEPAVLQNVKQCLNQDGYFILNLVCRAEELRAQTIKDLKEIFQNVSSYKVDQEVNEIFFCTNKSLKNWKEDFQNAAVVINKNVTTKKLQPKSIINCNDFIKSIKFSHN